MLLSSCTFALTASEAPFKAFSSLSSRSISIFLQVSINFKGDKFEEISKTTLKNFGLFGFGHDKLS